MLEFEKSRFSYSTDIQSDVALIDNLKIMSTLKSRLDSIQESGALTGSLKNVECRIKALKVYHDNAGIR